VTGRDEDGNKAKFRDLRRDLDSGAGPAWPVRSAMRWMTGWRPGRAAGPTGPGSSTGTPPRRQGATRWARTQGAVA